MEKLENVFNYFFAVLQWSNFVIAIIGLILCILGYDFSVINIIYCLCGSAGSYLSRLLIALVFDRIDDCKDDTE